MSEVLHAPDCCGPYLGQLFSRIAAGCGDTYFKVFCSACRQGKTGKEVEVDFTDGKPIRGMTKEMLDRFTEKHARSWKVVFTDDTEPGSMPSQCGYRPRRAFPSVEGVTQV